MRPLAYVVCLLCAVGGCKKKAADDDDLGAAQHFDEKSRKDRGEELDPGDEESHVATDAQPFGVESSHIVFKESGGGLERTVEIWTASHGESVIVVQRGEVEHTSVWHDGKAFSWSSSDNKVTHGSSRPRVARLSVLSTLDRRQLSFQGFQERGQDSVAGQDCTVWQNDKVGVTVCNWNGIDLRYVKGDPDSPQHLSEATLVEEVVSLPAELLVPPGAD